MEYLSVFSPIIVWTKKVWTRKTLNMDTFQAASAFNPNKAFNSTKAGLFEGSFFWGRGVNLTHPQLHISRRSNLIPI